MSRLIDADAFEVVAYKGIPEGYNDTFGDGVDWILEKIDRQPTIEPERTEYIPDTKAMPSERDCVDLSERVTATFYDEEHEEWSQKTVTIRDVLDSVCDEYTILPSAQPERRKGKWIDFSMSIKGVPTEACGECGEWSLGMGKNFCPNCGSYNGGE